MSKKLKSLHKPCDKLDKYDNEPYMKNPLLKLSLDDIRSYRRQSQIEQSAKVIEIISNIISFTMAYFAAEQNWNMSKAS